MKPNPLNPAAEVRQVDNLKDLAHTIKIEFSAFQSLRRDGAKCAWNLGKYLTDAKDRLARDGKPWLEWLKENVKQVGERQAQRFMKLFNDLPNPKSAAVADLHRAWSVICGHGEAENPGPDESLSPEAATLRLLGLAAAQRLENKDAPADAEPAPEQSACSPHERVKIGDVEKIKAADVERVFASPRHALTDWPFMLTSFRERLQPLLPELDTADKPLAAKFRRAARALRDLLDRALGPEAAAD
jgi:hypothetical protein